MLCYCLFLHPQELTKSHTWTRSDSLGKGRSGSDPGKNVKGITEQDPQLKSLWVFQDPVKIEENRAFLGKNTRKFKWTYVLLTRFNEFYLTIHNDSLFYPYTLTPADPSLPSDVFFASSDPVHHYRPELQSRLGDPCPCLLQLTFSWDLTVPMYYYWRVFSEISNIFN